MSLVVLASPGISLSLLWGGQPPPHAHWCLTHRSRIKPAQGCGLKSVELCLLFMPGILVIAIESNSYNTHGSLVVISLSLWFCPDLTLPAIYYWGWLLVSDPGQPLVESNGFLSWCRWESFVQDRQIIIFPRHLAMPTCPPKGPLVTLFFSLFPNTCFMVLFMAKKG